MQVVRESVWSSLEAGSCPATELLTLTKTSNLQDLQVSFWCKVGAGGGARAGAEVGAGAGTEAGAGIQAGAEK